MKETGTKQVTKTEEWLNYRCVCEREGAQKPVPRRCVWSGGWKRPQGQAPSLKLKAGMHSPGKRGAGLQAEGTTCAKALRWREFTLSSKVSSPGTLAPPLGLLGASGGLMEVCAACHVHNACTEEVLGRPRCIAAASRTLLIFREDMRGPPQPPPDSSLAEPSL